MEVKEEEEVMAATATATLVEVEGAGAGVEDIVTLVKGEVEVRGLVLLGVWQLCYG